MTQTVGLLYDCWTNIIGHLCCYIMAQTEGRVCYVIVGPYCWTITLCYGTDKCRSVT